jgi:hypothetical protein
MWFIYATSTYDASHEGGTVEASLVLGNRDEFVDQGLLSKKNPFFLMFDIIVKKKKKHNIK